MPVRRWRSSTRWRKSPATRPASSPRAVRRSHAPNGAGAADPPGDTRGSLPPAPARGPHTPLQITCGSAIWISSPRGPLPISWPPGRPAGPRTRGSWSTPTTGSFGRSPSRVGGPRQSARFRGSGASSALPGALPVRSTSRSGGTTCTSSRRAEGPCAPGRHGVVARKRERGAVWEVGDSGDRPPWTWEPRSRPHASRRHPRPPEAPVHAGAGAERRLRGAHQEPPWIAPATARPKWSPRAYRTWTAFSGRRKRPIVAAGVGVRPAPLHCPRGCRCPAGFPGRATASPGPAWAPPAATPGPRPSASG